MIKMLVVVVVGVVIVEDFVVVAQVMSAYNKLLYYSYDMFILQAVTKTTFARTRLRDVNLTQSRVMPVKVIMNS
jgi:hypothetical protein